jgi:hypothetical protein
MTIRYVCDPRNFWIFLHLVDDYNCDVDFKMGDAPNKAREVHSLHSRYTKGYEDAVIVEALAGLRRHDPETLELALHSFLSGLRTVWTPGGGVVWKKL